VHVCIVQDHNISESTSFRSSKLEEGKHHDRGEERKEGKKEGRRERSEG